MKNLFPRLALASVLASLLISTQLVLAQGTAFTYQGRLSASGSPASGNYDFTFALFNNSNGISGQVGSTLTDLDVGVTNGLFTVLLDFGANFPGAGRWLSVDVRTNGGSSFTALSPLQALTPTPYAVTASNLSGTLPASQLTGTAPSTLLSGSYSGALNLNNAGNTFTGNGSNVANVNAAALNGLTATNFWQLGGNNVAAGKFLGSTNNQPVEIWANGTRALRLEPNATAPNVIGGSVSNSDTTVGGVLGTTIGGGLYNTNVSSYCFIGGGYNNTIQTNANYSMIGGGEFNMIQANTYDSTIGGGDQNTIQSGADDSVIAGGEANTIHANADVSMIGGGYNNTIQTNAEYSMIGGGYNNMIQDAAAESVIGGGDFNTIQAYAEFAVIGGGQENAILPGAYYATIPGGYQNEAAGEYSFAAGQQAQALYRGDFVWADSQDAVFAATAANQFLIRAAGNVGINEANPGATLHVASGSSGVAAPNASSVGAFESSGNAYLNVLTPSASESGILFGNTNSTADGGVLYNSGSVTRGLQFRTDGNVARMVITSAGDVGIGNTAPGHLLVVGNSGSPAYCDGGNWVNGSDRNSKEDFAVINPAEVLQKVAAIPITQWQYKVQPGHAHIGPMAQDFHAAFGLNGADDKHIATVDEGGVALAAIQGLNQKLEGETKARDAEIQGLKKELAEQKDINQRMERRLGELEKAAARLANQSGKTLAVNDDIKEKQ